MEWKGCGYRIEEVHVFDLLSNEEDLIDDDRRHRELMGSSLRLKSTFCTLDHAVKSRSISLTQIRYNDTAHVLQEVIAALVPSL
ncbi:hypothetical protein C4D60_Mb02t12070 [Musa balbisiana]|uniref:Uncharacterized protein n=1 Tax=Musa balbisiana TaxID=52838 RepID=A0A4S8IA25_MUSBA|nr:hypothetical protein C4D60_Mb02t12070 [Musa balbisiana]